MKFVSDSIYDTYVKDGKTYRTDLDYAFVHYLTGPWALTRGIAAFFEVDFDVLKNLNRLNLKYIYDKFFYLFINSLSIQ